MTLFHSTVSLHFVVLWLIVLYVPGVHGVCTVCFGQGQGCGGNSATCVWLTGVAANVAAIGAAAGGAISVLALLPHKVVRLFPKSVLDIVASIAARDPTSSFDPNGKSVNEIVTAVKFSHISKVDAVLHLSDRISQILDNRGS